MYPITCVAGYNVPTASGRMEITGFCVTVSDPTAASQFAIVDDEDIKPDWKCGRLLTTITDKKHVLANIKGIANSDSVLSYEFAEPVKTRYGISIYATNMVLGSACVYRR